MSSISFDKAEYNRGETATITYVDAPSDGYIQIVAPDRTYPYTASKSGSGAVTWLIPADAPLGQYTVELWSRSFRLPLRDTMKVVSGAAPPPVEGETRELDVGDYEVTWTLSGNDILKAEIRVTDTGVTCLSVTGGACNSITAPGVLVIAFTVTGYLKSAGAPPTRGYLSVNTSPTGALVTVNGVSCGTTPVTNCELDTGTKTVKITKSGYNTVTRTVTISAGATTNLGTITLTPTAAPPTGIGGWIDESGVTNLTKDHAVYIFFVSTGAVAAADGKYAKLSPKPSRLDPSLATKNNAIGIYFYSQGAMAAGNGKTGCNY